MFIVKTIHDMIRIPPHVLAVPTVQAIHREIDDKYPNRVLIDEGLVIGRYGDCLKVGNGVCVAGDGGSHHECSFRLIIFRPFVEEVVIGSIVKSTPEGIQVSLGFFSDIFIPAYWMLNPSRYDPKTGVWAWTPKYDDDDEEEEGEEDEADQDGEGDEEGANNKAASSANDEDAAEEEEEGDETQYEMYLGAEIRVKVKSINFTQITNTAKGMQATMTTTSHMPMTTSSSTPGGSGSSAGDLASSRPVRKRSSSVGIESENLPASMHIVASICEDGLGLPSWWAQEEEEEEEEEEAEEEVVEEGDE